MNIFINIEWEKPFYASNKTPETLKEEFDKCLVYKIQCAKIISETSFVIKMELKKQVKTKNKTSPRVFLTLSNSLRTNISNTDRFFKISTISIIAKRRMIVSQLM